MDSILRLLYTSQARIDLTEAEVLQILHQSRENNEKTRITGILCYNKRDFIQVLEGPEKKRPVALHQNHRRSAASALQTGQH